MSYTRGISRYQIQMPALLDETIAKDNPVRLIDEFVNVEGTYDVEGTYKLT